MVSTVPEEGDAINCSQIFTIRLKEIPPGNSTNRGYIAITVYIRAIGFQTLRRMNQIVSVPVMSQITFVMRNS